MEITTLLDIHSREELYQWYLENHDKASDFWLRINRAEAELTDIVLRGRIPFLQRELDVRQEVGEYMSLQMIDGDQRFIEREG